MNIPCFGCTPKLLARVVERVMKGQDLAPLLAIERRARFLRAAIQTAAWFFPTPQILRLCTTITLPPYFSWISRLCKHHS